MSLVPMVLHNDGKGERAMDLYSRMLQDRIIFINGEVEDNMANLIAAQILFLDSENQEKDINLYINSPGGGVYAGLQIYNAMKTARSPIVTTVTSFAASMGAFLLAGGDKGRRQSLPVGRIMIHQPSSGGRGGKITDQYEAVQESLLLKKMMNKILAENCGKTEQEMHDYCEKDYYMSPEEAIKFGLIDQIVPYKTK